MPRYRDMTPAERATWQRQQLGKIAAAKRLADPNYDGAAATAAARAAAQTALEREVDPEGRLPPAERARKAAALRGARLREGRLAAKLGRPARKIRVGDVEAAA